MRIDSEEAEKSDWIEYDPDKYNCDTCLVQASCNRTFYSCVVLQLRNKYMKKPTLYGKKIKSIKYRVLKGTDVVTEIAFDISDEEVSQHVIELIKVDKYTIR